VFKDPFYQTFAPLTRPNAASSAAYDVSQAVPPRKPAPIESAFIQVAHYNLAARIRRFA
jgi:hypothetical protein